MKAVIIFFQTSKFLVIVCQYKKITAKIAPSWIMISKLLTKSVCIILNNFEARTMCPVDDIGRNSVTPSIMDKIIACR